MKRLHFKKWCIWLLATTVTLGTASATFAKNEHNRGREPQGHGKEQGQRQRQGRDQEQGQGHEHYARGRDRYEAPNGFRYQYREDRLVRGAGPEHDFRVGQRLPLGWHQRTYVVDDWRGHYLSAPPRGYHWVQTGSDYVLWRLRQGLFCNCSLAIKASLCAVAHRWCVKW